MQAHDDGKRRLSDKMKFLKVKAIYPFFENQANEVHFINIDSIHSIRPDLRFDSAALTPVCGIITGEDHYFLDDTFDNIDAHIVELFE